MIHRGAILLPADEVLNGGNGESAGVAYAAPITLVRTTRIPRRPNRFTPIVIGGTGSVGAHLVNKLINSLLYSRVTVTAAHDAGTKVQRRVEAGVQARDICVVPMRAGNSVGLLSSIESAGVILRRRVKEAESILNQRLSVVFDRYEAGSQNPRSWCRL